jgi:hypothetical protein
MSLLLILDGFDTSQPTSRELTSRLWAATPKRVKTNLRGHSVPCFELDDQSAAIAALPGPPRAVAMQVAEE